MRIVRVLVYEGPTEEVKKQVEGSAIDENRTQPFGGKGIIREVFRGQLSEPGQVFFMQPQVVEPPCCTLFGDTDQHEPDCPNDHVPIFTKDKESEE